MQQVATQKLVDVSCNKILTAHASKAGVALITNGYNDGVLSVELVAIFSDKTHVEIIKPAQFFNTMNEGRLDQVDGEDDEEEQSQYQQLMELSRFRAFGNTSNFTELAEERIAYDVRSEDVPFVAEMLDFSKHGDKRKIILPGELKGFSEVTNAGALTDDLLEPLSIEEGLNFVNKVFSSYQATMGDISNGPSVDMWLRPVFSKAVETVADLLVMMEDRREDPNILLEYLKVSEEEWRRAKTTDARDSLGDNWCHANRYNIGEREGTVEDKSRQNDRNFTTHEQYHTFGERIDGKFILSEELQNAEKKNMNIVWSMYYKEGEVKNQELFDALKKQGMSHEAATEVLRNRGDIATKGENKGWSERSVYFMRCAAERDEVFAEKLWHILTWPLDIVEDCMNGLRAKYKQSVAECRPGPGRQKLNGRWTEAPLVGAAAIAHIKRTGAGTLKGKRINKNVTLHIGATWHKLFLSKKHMDALEDALLWRQGTIKLNIGGEIVEEKFEQTMACLPREYVLNTYGKKS